LIHDARTDEREIKRHYLQTTSYAKEGLNGEAVGRTQLGKIQRNIDLLCAVLKMTSYSF
jgi:hypothetical protein